MKLHVKNSWRNELENYSLCAINANQKNAKCLLYFFLRLLISSRIAMALM